MTTRRANATTKVVTTWTPIGSSSQRINSAGRVFTGPRIRGPGSVPRMNGEKAWEKAGAWMRTLTDLDGAAAVLEWDRETIMPPGAAEARGSQLATLATLRHRALGDPAVEAFLAVLAHDDDPVRHACARQAERERRRALTLPEDLVRALTEASSRSVAIWTDARPAGDLQAWIDALEPLVALTREQGDHLADGGDRYDALLDMYEPGTTSKSLAPVMDGLAHRVGPLVRELAGRGGPALPAAGWSDSGQITFAASLAEQIGFDPARGLVGRTAHPVTMSLGAGDTRLSTRVDASDPLSSIMAVMHEGGHALYDQGIPAEWRGTLIGDAPSLGAHESQSRFWENHVGRSPAFWERIAPDLARTFPEAAQGLSPMDYVRALNRVERSPIRVESDEVTYDLHIVLRSRLERALIMGDLQVEDLPSAFDEGLQELVGVRPASTSEGAMQDIHWAAGIFGYFPTYTLGNLYAAALASAFEREVGPIDDVLRADGFVPFLTFMRDRVHRHGRLMDTPELMRTATGHDLSAEPFAQHLARTYGSA